jgi:KDO2-lipid IV(A) lauroyltransferase
MGNWELLAQWMHWNSVCGVGGIVVKRQPNPHLNAIIERLRGTFGMRTLYRDDNPVGILRLLRSGRAIGMAPDQDVASVGGMFIDFFGRPAYTPIGPARLAWTANVPIRVAYVRRGEDGRQQVRFEEPILPDRSKPRHEEIARMTRAWSAQLEAAIRAQPDQWLWFHDRWKTTPEKLAGRGRERAEL